jgi:hypothetical protein
LLEDFVAGCAHGTQCNTKSGNSHGFAQSLPVAQLALKPPHLALASGTGAGTVAFMMALVWGVVNLVGAGNFGAYCLQRFTYLFSSFHDSCGC